MGYFTHNNELLVDLLQRIDEVQNMKLLNRAPKDFRSRTSFQDAEELIDWTVNKLVSIKDAGIDPMSPHLPELKTLVAQLADKIANLEKFDYVRDPEAVDKYEVADSRFKTLIGDIENHIKATGFRNAYCSVLTFSLTGTVYAEKLLKIESLHQNISNEKAQFDEIVDKFNKWSRQAITSAETHSDRLSELEKRLDELLLETGTSKDAVRFHKEAKSQNGWAAGWCTGAVAISAALIYYLFYQFEPELTKVAGGTFTAMVPILSTRLVALSLASVGIFFCLRNYSACRHNATLNQHRAHALSTFRLFRDGTDDDDTKNAILLETTKVIFSPSSTGYLKAADEGNPGAQIIEVIRNVSSGKGTHSGE